MQKSLRNAERNEESAAEEIANSITHGAGLALAAAGLVVMVVSAALHGTALHVVCCSVYGATLVLLYASSTLYHALSGPRLKRVLRAIDHSSIFLLIAGTYTPFTLLVLKGGWGWSLFGVVWGIAVVGVVFKSFAVERFPILSPLLYLAMGWVVIVAIKPLLADLPPGGLALLFAGGIFYSAGLIFYAWRGLPFNHAVWHLFVLAGSVSHFFGVYFYALPHSA